MKYWTCTFVIACSRHVH